MKGYKDEIRLQSGRGIACIHTNHGHNCSIRHTFHYLTLSYLMYFNTTSPKRAEDEEEEEKEEEEEEIEPISSTGTLWFHSDGDSLSRLRAMGAFAYASSKGNGTEMIKLHYSFISKLPQYCLDIPLFISSSIAPMRD